MSTPQAAVAAETIRAYLVTMTGPTPEITEFLEELHEGQEVAVDPGYWSAQCRYSLEATGYAPEDVLEALSMAARAPEAPEGYQGNRIEWADAWQEAWDMVAGDLRLRFIPGESVAAPAVNPDLGDYLHLS